MTLNPSNRPNFFVFLQLIDMLFFILILLVFVVAYGIALQAMLYPNSDFGIALIEDVFKKAYWQIYGELFLEEIEGEILRHLIYIILYLNPL